VTTLAGSTQGYADGPGTYAQFSYPLALTVGLRDYIYVVDNLNNRLRLIEGYATPTFTSKLPTTSPTVISSQLQLPTQSPSLYPSQVPTFCPTCTGYQGNVVTVTNMEQSFFLSVDSSGVVYAAQFYQHTVISISPQAAVSKIAGSGSIGTVNGIGTNAQFSYPEGIAIDSVGSAIFICDQGNHAIRR
jgi:hypothetical protein